jgi:hypothetical protein
MCLYQWTSIKLRDINHPTEAKVTEVATRATEAATRDEWQPLGILEDHNHCHVGAEIHKAQHCKAPALNAVPWATLPATAQTNNRQTLTSLILIRKATMKRYQALPQSRIGWGP